MKVMRLATFLALIALLMIGVSTVLAQTGTSSYTGPAQSGTTLSAYVTATPYWEREYQWSIDKSVTPSKWHLFSGDSATSTYTVSVVKSGPVDKAWIAGEVCVTNGGDRPTRDLYIVVELQTKSGSGKFTTIASAVVNLTSKPELGPGESHCYSYTIDIPTAYLQEGRSFRVAANVTITNHSGWLPGGKHCPGPALCPFGPTPKSNSFAMPGPTVINDEITVTDTNGYSWTTDETTSWTYTKEFTCMNDWGKHKNTATIVETGQSDSAWVTVFCYNLKVKKDAYTAFKRTFNWTIDKTADKSALNLDIGASATVNYEVKVDATYTDWGWKVWGKIYVYNPAPIPATINDVTDVISPDIEANVKCPVSFPYKLPAWGWLTCFYNADLPNGNERVNTAKVELQNFHYANGEVTPNGTTIFSGTANIVFSDKPTKLIDECINVSDTLAGDLGMVCYKDLPKTFTYSQAIGPYSKCGEYSVSNTAKFVTNDKKVEGSDSWEVAVNVPCPSGCTLTQGYWKTHSKYGPAPYNKVWANIGEDKTFYLSGQTYYQVMQTEPSGGNAYYILAHQYIAAKLNIYNGAWAPSSVTDAIAWAETFFINYKPDDELNETVRAEAIYYAGVLAKFNEGYIGPGHCSE